MPALGESRESDKVQNGTMSADMQNRAAERTGCLVARRGPTRARERYYNCSLVNCCPVRIRQRFLLPNALVKQPREGLLLSARWLPRCQMP